MARNKCLNQSLFIFNLVPQIGQYFITIPATLDSAALRIKGSITILYISCSNFIVREQ